LDGDLRAQIKEPSSLYEEGRHMSCTTGALIAGQQYHNGNIVDKLFLHLTSATRIKVTGLSTIPLGQPRPNILGFQDE
jgi:hypothetical protein